MKKSMKFLAFLLSLVMILGLVPAVFAETPALADAEEIVVYYTNDVHTYIDGDLSYDNLADLKAATAAQAKGVALVDAGDHVQGTAYGSMDKGETIIELMNAASYDAATLGNHEFDYGMARALELTQELAEYDYLSANFYHEENGVPGESVFNAYKVLDFDGTKVAFVGVTTPESFTKSTPAYFQDEEGNYIYGIAGGTDGAALYAAVQTAIDAAAAEADYVIGLGHLGNDPASKPWTSAELIANTTGLDAFIDGHSHTTAPMELVKDLDGNEVVLTQTGEYFGAIGRMSITAEGITTSLITEYTGSDEAVKTIKDAWMTSVDELLGEVIGYAEVTLDNYDADGNRLVRSQETNTGDFCADALYYLFDNQELDVDVAIMNGGGVRSKAITGELSYKSCKEIHTFGNVACLITVTGQQILDALEWGAKNAGSSENGGFLQVSGLTYDIHTSIPSTVQADDKGVWTGGPTGEYRVKNVKVFQDGEYVDLDLDAKYNLAGYNYTLRDLGDGFAMFEGGEAVLDYVMEDYMVLANYVKSFPVGENGLPTIAADSGYADVNGQGRIRKTAFTDCPVDSFYYESVLWASQKEIAKGITATEFMPTENVTRAQAVTFLWRAAGCPVVEEQTPFTDLNPNAYYYDAICWAYAEGIANGMTGTTFEPGTPCTRAQLVTFLWRLAEEPSAGTDTVFTDLNENSFYYDAVLWANAEGIAEGMTDTTFEPGTISSRAHAVTFLYRCVN